MQYAQSYAPIKLRAAIIPVTNIGSRLAMPLILIGLLLSYAADVSYFFVYLGIACFGLSLVFQLVTQIRSVGSKPPGWQGTASQPPVLGPRVQPKSPPLRAGSKKPVFSS